MRRSFTAAAIAVVAMATLIAPAHAAGSAGSVIGGGSGVLPDGFGSFTGDRLSIQLTARTGPSGTALGRFHLVHLGKDGGVMADLSGTIDCVAVSSGEAFSSGMITAGFVADAPGFNPIGQIAAITVLDQATGDRAGVDLSFFGGPHTVAPCESVPLYLAIDQGGFTVTS